MLLLPSSLINALGQPKEGEKGEFCLPKQSTEIWDGSMDSPSSGVQFQLGMMERNLGAEGAFPELAEFFLRDLLGFCAPLTPDFHPGLLRGCSQGEKSPPASPEGVYSFSLMELFHGE